MKSLVKGALLVAAGSFVMVACNKDQACINKLDGSWEATGGTFWINGVEQPEDTSASSAVTTYEFTKFKMKDAEEGDLVIKTVDGSNTTTTNATFNVSDDCTKFWWSTNDTTATDDMTGNISELTSKNFTCDFSMTVGSDTWKWEVELEKQ